jgi:DNA polymerase I-like protein with 3'-5' exonuclease and polymerase domains
MPGVKELAERASRAASKFGYVETQFGRRIRFPHGWKLYKASGLTIQATAADINKMNWLLIEQALGDEGRLILNTHDSYGMSLPEDWQPYWERVKQTVEAGFPWFRVPIVLELSGFGPNWWQAIKK